jgi:hypothetical protein
MKLSISELVVQSMFVTDIRTSNLIMGIDQRNFALIMILLVYVLLLVVFVRNIKIVPFPSKKIRGCLSRKFANFERKWSL